MAFLVPFARTARPLAWRNAIRKRRHSAVAEPAEESPTLLDVREAILRREAVWGFTPQSIDDEVLQDILALTQRAPSGYNVQPWTVIVVRDAAIREELSTAMLGGNARRVLEAPVTAVFCADLEPSRRVPRLIELQRANGVPEEVVARLPYAVSIFGGEGRVAGVLKRVVSEAGSPLRPMPSISSTEAWSYKNTMLAAQNFMLAAQAHGVDTCPMEGLDARRVRHALSIPERYGVPLAVAAGYAAPEQRPRVRSARFPPEEVCFLDAFGEPFPGVRKL
ncbi:unnamed protein product [Phaeothamnion confervicola]